MTKLFTRVTIVRPQRKKTKQIPALASKTFRFVLIFSWKRSIVVAIADSIIENYDNLLKYDIKINKNNLNILPLIQNPKLTS